ncbi:deleted in azoospermia protein 4 isoform X1 [Euwallacea fornicatus]|uniref:deleted in azoospermia protein 4 isoform X1 n=2 Tax=Euwallacea fornicatus TaxID=995702 RepID=UPI00338D4C8C
MGLVARQLPQPVMSNGATNAVMTQQQPQQNSLQQSNGGCPISGKKGPSNGSSGGPTPAGTPIQNGTGQQGPSPPPLINNAPKYGTLVPNRIFVGGISASTTEGELMQLFSSYGTVKAAKIIQDRAGVSKGYGFITFESEDDARRPLRDPDNIILRERRLNIAPAIKKQPFGRPPAAPPYDTQCQNDGRSSAPSAHQAALQPPIPPFFFGGAPPFYPGATAYYPGPPVPTMVSTAAQAQVQVSQAGQEQAAAAAAAQQAVYQAPPMYQTQTGPPQAGPYTSMMFPQAIYMPQQYSLVPYDYTLYSAGAGGPPANGGVLPPFASTASASNGGSSPPRPPCYAPASGPAEAIIYSGPPPHLFHPAAMDPTIGAPGPLYASTDGTFDPMVTHAMGQFGPLANPYAINEDGSVSDRLENCGTPRSGMTGSPPSEQRSTATPVVSILSLDYQQEKDLASMQGGRRPPPQHTIQHNNNNLPFRNALPVPQPLQLQQQRRGPQMNGAPRRPFTNRPFNIQHNTYKMQQPPQACFVPPTRRPRKPPRRIGSGNSTNEIGAGDAPLLSQEDGLAAQVEILKI